MTLALSGCGFRLAGPVAMPASMASVYVQTPDRRGLLARHLDDTLRASGVTVLGSPAGTLPVLRVIDDDTGTRILSVTPRGGPEEIELYHRVRYDIVRDGQTILEPRTVTLTRNYRYDKDDVLGTEEEGADLRALLAAEMAATIVRSIAAAQE